jgi:predicted nucleic acid-binding protein
LNRFLLDTSAVIAIGRGELDDLRARADATTICALTVCGLHHGVLAATPDQRSGRLALLAWVERTFRPLPIDERVAPAYGRLALAARTARRDARRGTADLLIAATAETHGLALLTRDESSRGSRASTRNSSDNAHRPQPARSRVPRSRPPGYRVARRP